VPYSLTIRREAEADISEAFQYYESCRPNLGSDFLLCIAGSLSRIQKNPEQYQKVYKQIHRALVSRFLYGIYFTVIGTNVVVLAVVHARRNPEHWKSRT
jgi:toxin ParE1/3/4